MSELQYEREKDQGEEPRKDFIGYCPRVDAEILLLDGCCFCPSRGTVCHGCVFDMDFVKVKIMLLLCDLLKVPRGNRA